MQAEIRSEVVWRLNTSVGHLQVIRELVEAGRPCEEVLQQLKTVKAALCVAGIRLLACQIKCSEEIIINGNKEARMDELVRLQKL
ncbi:MAG TPA: metal-sensing transcriptional repressor, partial [Anaerolineales bacterium]